MKPHHPLEPLVAEQTAAFNNPAATEDDRVFVYRKIQEAQKRAKEKEK